MNKLSFLNNLDPQTIEQLYQAYIFNPELVDEDWIKFFQGFDFALTNFKVSSPQNQNDANSEHIANEFKVINLIDGYRQRGHFFTKTNPVRSRRKYFPTLDIQNFGLNPADLETVFQAGTQIGLGSSKLKDIISHLEQTYCKYIGVEYVYIRKPEIVEWLQKKMEKTNNEFHYSEDQKKDFYHHFLFFFQYCECCNCSN